MYTLTHKCTKDTKLIWFQYRIFYRILGTKKYLVKCRIGNNPNCSFCGSEEESIEHLFFHCPFSSNIWEEIKNWINSQSSCSINFEITDILFGKPGDQNNALNYIILLVKYLIFSCAKNDNQISFEKVRQFLKYHYFTEKLQYKLNQRYNIFEKKWQTLQCLFET